MKICILGGTGFVGRSLINALSKENYTITVITRDFDKNKDLAIYPNLKLIQEDVYNEKRMLEVSKSHDVLINLIGILNEKGFRGKSGSNMSGSGIGLALARDLARQVGGDLKLIINPSQFKSSLPESGNAFIFTLEPK